MSAQEIRTLYEKEGAKIFSKDFRSKLVLLAETIIGNRHNLTPGTPLIDYAVRRFLHSAKYTHAGLINVINQYFNQEVALRDAVIPVGVVTTDFKNESSLVLNSMRARMHANDYRHNVNIRVAARATTAAPTYFDPIKLENTSESSKSKPERSTSPFSRNPPDYVRDDIILEDGGTTKTI